MFVTEVIKMKVEAKDKLILDEASKKAKLLYNSVLSAVLNGHSLEFKKMLGLAHEIKRNNEELTSLNNDIVFNIVKRIISAFSKYEKGLAEKPHLHNDLVWFSLYLSKDIKIINKMVYFSILNQKMELRLCSKLIKHQRVISYLIKKTANTYYLHVALEKNEKTLIKTGQSLAIDPNHKNFLMAIDNKGVSYEFSNLNLIVYFDKKICEIKQKRKQTQVGSRKYQHYSLAIDKMYIKRNTELKTALYAISNFITKRYDKIAIGNYVPRKELATNEIMQYKMLKESVIGEFRDILRHVALKNGKEFVKVDEKNTTAKCFNCGYYERKKPDVRLFSCPKCHKIYNRDLNSAINIGIKAKFLSAQDYVDLDLSMPTYALEYSHTSGLLVKKLNNFNS